ncbi:MAG: DUF2283 domain-containing protein [Synergistales bacterium]|nr:DUF2283 domain-containing protein [Synergistales bacterium]
MAEAMSYVKLAEAVSQAVVGSGLPLLRVSYDPAGDVLYVHFSEEPVAADDSEFVDDDTVGRTSSHPEYPGRGYLGGTGTGTSDAPTGMPPVFSRRSFVTPQEDAKYHAFQRP